MLPDRREQRPVRLHPVVAAEQRAPGLEVADVAIDGVQFRGGDVRGVADDEVEPAAERVGPRALDERDVDAEPLGVRTGDGQRAGAHIGPDHLDARHLRGQGDRDAPAAGAEIGDAHRLAIARTQQRERPLDERLGLGPRDQHIAGDREGAPVELPRARDVGHRLALATPAHQLADGRQLALVEGAVELQVDVEAAQPERLGAEQLGVEAGGRAAVIAEVRRAHAEHVDELGLGGRHLSRHARARRRRPRPRGAGAPGPRWTAARRAGRGPRRPRAAAGAASGRCDGR